MSNNKRTGHGLFGKGYYIALILCAAAIGITGYVYYRNTTEQDAVLSQQEQNVPVAESQAQDVPVLATQPRATEAQQPTQVTAPRALKTTSPVSGEMVSGYSMEALSYNQTTRDWRVHNGMDIAAPAGTDVVAAADGEVYTTYEDDVMGRVVVIRHTGGYMTTYASLEKEVQVQPGDAVTVGQVIGMVGESALTESAIGPHVHFSVTYQNAPMDPAEFLNAS